MRKRPSIFISYRRDDTGGEAGRLRDSLIGRLGPATVFLDFEKSEPGRDYMQVLDRAMASCRVLLAVIGPTWETIHDARDRPRLKNQRDVVRNEIRAGLERRRIRVVPVLVNRETLPRPEALPEVLRPILRRQSFQIHRDRWHQDVDLLIERLGIAPQAKAGLAADPSQARFVSASVEWKRMPTPDPTPRCWVVYVYNDSNAPLTVGDVVVESASCQLTIEDLGTVRPGGTLDYELEEGEFAPTGDRPTVTVRFVDSFGQEWVIAKNALRPYVGRKTRRS